MEVLGKVHRASVKAWKGRSFKGFELLTIIYEASILGQAHARINYMKDEKCSSHLFFFGEYSLPLPQTTYQRGVIIWSFYRHSVIPAAVKLTILRT